MSASVREAGELAREVLLRAADPAGSQPEQVDGDIDRRSSRRPRGRPRRSRPPWRPRRASAARAAPARPACAVRQRLSDSVRDRIGVVGIHEHRRSAGDLLGRRAAARHHRRAVAPSPRRPAARILPAGSGTRTRPRGRTGRAGRAGRRSRGTARRRRPGRAGPTPTHRQPRAAAARAGGAPPQRAGPRFLRGSIVPTNSTNRSGRPCRTRTLARSAAVTPGASRPTARRGSARVGSRAPPDRNGSRRSDTAADGAAAALEPGTHHLDAMAGETFGRVDERDIVHRHDVGRSGGGGDRDRRVAHIVGPVARSTLGQLARFHDSYSQRSRDRQATHLDRRHERGLRRSTVATGHAHQLHIGARRARARPRVRHCQPPGTSCQHCSSV